MSSSCVVCGKDIGYYGEIVCDECRLRYNDENVENYELLLELSRGDLDLSKCPCNGCEDRVPAGDNRKSCHCSCEKYLSWKSKEALLKEVEVKRKKLEEGFMVRKKIKKW